MEELSPEELSARIAEAAEVVRHLAAHMEVFESSQCRDFRRALQPLVEHQRKKMFGGVSLQQHQSDLQRKKRSESMRSIQKAEDKKLLENTLLRSERLKRLVQIEDQDGLEHSLVLDGCAEDGSAVNSTVLPCDLEASERVGDNTQCGTGSSDSPSRIVAPEEHLHQFRSCYICKRRFSKLHHFYHSLCELCAAHNWQKRMQTCDMTGRVCLVTGGRVKIGFQCCLKLLRCGATVISTSRFPVDAAKRFAVQKDFGVWKDNLFVVGLDLRDLAYLEFFCKNLCKSFSRLDVIINNACQTVRRPRGYYAHMLDDEAHMRQLARSEGCCDINLDVRNEQAKDSCLFPGKCLAEVEEGGANAGDNKSKKMRKHVMEGTDVRALFSLESNLRRLYDMENSVETAGQLCDANNSAIPIPPSAVVTSSTTMSGTEPFASPRSLSLLSSAEMSQVPLTEEDHTAVACGHLLPANLRDVNNQQIDLRRKNSWLLKTDEVETPEVAEVFAINSISPFVLISKLKKLLVSGKKGFADDIAADATPAGQLRRTKVQDASRLRTLNDFILASMQGQGGGAVPEEDAWSKSAANHRGTNLAGVCAENCSFIVNVSSMEGKFYRPKTEYHSHTNMAKAALNMLTRTASVDYQSSNIYMSAVDTGWINDENPLEKASRIAKTSDFCTPLDEVDAAARILDPIFTPIRYSQLQLDDDVHGLCSPPFGCFLKDYHISEW